MTYHVAPYGASSMSAPTGSHLASVASGAAFSAARRILSEVLEDVDGAKHVLTEGSYVEVHGTRFAYIHGEANSDTIPSSPTILLEVRRMESDGPGPIALDLKEPILETFGNAAPAHASNHVHASVLRRAWLHLQAMTDPDAAEAAAQAVRQRQTVMRGLAARFLELVEAEGHGDDEWTISHVAGVPYWSRKLSATWIRRSDPNRRHTVTLAISDGCAPLVPLMPSMVEMMSFDADHPSIRAVPMKTTVRLRDLSEDPVSRIQARRTSIRAVPMTTTVRLRDLSKDPVCRIQARRTDVPDVLPAVGSGWEKGLGL